jgi:phage major head subunit gpT-like protein
MELLLLYVWMKLDVFSVAIAVTSSLLLAWWLSTCVYRLDSSYWPKRRSKAYVAWQKTNSGSHFDGQPYEKVPLFEVVPYMRWVLVSAVMGIVGAILLPSTKEAAVLVAGHYALKMADSPEATKVLAVLRKKANEYLDAELAARPAPAAK